MYISDNKKRQAVRIAGNYIAASLFCALFGAVYELFSHEVYSYSMIYAFVIPLAGGALPFLAVAMGHIGRFPGRISRSLYHAAITTFTIGSIMKGVLEIYGTASGLTKWYWIAGSILLLSAAVLYVTQRVQGHSKKIPN